MKRVIVVAAMAAMLACAPFSRAAAEDAPKPNFTFTVAPYAWLTGLYGTVGVGGKSADVSASFFGDLAKYLNFAAMIHADFMYKDKVGLLGEFNYALLGDSASKKRVAIDGQMSLILSDVAGVYRLGTVDLGKDGGSPATFDLLAGARIWELATKIDASTAIGLGRSMYASKSWVDPIVGARVMFHLGESWELDFRGGVGGFGLSSNFTWDAMALAGYTFWEHGTFLLGYRAVGVDHTEGSGSDKFTFNATLCGPIIGLAFRF